MTLSSLAIGLVAGIGGASLLLSVVLLVALQRRRTSRITSLSSSLERGGSALDIPPAVLAVSLDPAQHSTLSTSKTHDALVPPPLSMPGSPYTPSSPPPVYQLHKTSDSYSGTDNKPHISPPNIVTDVSRYSGVVSSPFGIPLSPVLASPNPRTASYHSKVSSTVPSLRPSVAAELSGSWLPRYMTVCVTFTPRAEDEMLIAMGENLRLLEMFEDQWCLVQRVGKLEGELGVIPTFCLADPQPVKDAKGGLTVPQAPFMASGCLQAR